jgi:hypothetical protein
MTASYPNDSNTFTFVLYRYDPTLVGAILFATLFSATTSLHAYQLIKTKTWYFIPFLIGGICKLHLESNG